LNGTGVVAALDTEARTLGPAVRRQDGLASLSDGALLAVSGMGGDLAAIAARRLVHAGVSGLMSYGLAGGLDPRLRAGSVLLPNEVISHGGGRFATADAWRARLSAAVAKAQPVAAGNLLTSATMIDTVSAKAAAFRDTGAVAVDMESLAIAEVAAANGLPFVVLRVIVDTAGDVLPGSVVAASVQGRLSIRRLVQGLVAAPADLLALLRLLQRYRAARRSLAAAAAAVRLSA
jgi:adenosylhomocysteine nucleosidase